MVQVMDTLSLRQLNRATLDRQMLLDRQRRGLVEAVGTLIGLQGQVSEGPYQGLWSRLAGFRHEDLTELIVERTLVRATSLRATLHLHSVDDLLGLRPHVQPTLDRMWQSAFGRRFGDNDAAAVRKAGVKLLNKAPTTGGALGKALQAQFPDGEPLAKSTLLQVKEILIQVPPTRLWGSGHAPVLARAENWVPKPHRRPLKLDELVLRYLRAYGPASVGDMQSWSGIGKLAPVFAALGDRLRTYAGEDGRVLYDLADAALPDADVEAPVRFLPDYDNAILGYERRERIVSAGDQKRLAALTRSFRAVLVDGVVAGSWSIGRKKQDATLTLTPFRRLLKREQRAIEQEGVAFLAFMEDGAERREVVFAPVAD